MNMKEKGKREKEVSVRPVMGQPETANELVNKYGTDSGNQFPAIAQGLPHEPERQIKQPPES